MTTEKDPSQEQHIPLTRALADHSAEGAEILYSQPAPLIRLSIILMACTVIALVIWSFIGQADIIVQAPGVLSPEYEVRRIYSPAEGELEYIHVKEGDPVSEGDELARIRSQDAVNLAVRARRAELELSLVELEVEQFPATLGLLEQQTELFADDIRIKQEQLYRLLISGPETRKQDQLARLQALSAKLEQARNDRSVTKAKWEAMLEISGEGVAAIDVQVARIAYDRAESDYEQALADRRALESQFSSETTQDKSQLKTLRLELEAARIEHEQKLMETEQASEKLDLRVAEARVTAEALRRIRVETTEHDNILVILSPVSGVVTRVAFTQPGDNVQPQTPLLNVAPVDARKVLWLDIAERDGGFLVEGAAVKMKFQAFPYQQHGFINGTLEYLSPTTQRASTNDIPVYKGFVSLEADHFVVRGVERPLRYGMTAIAEIVVRERRLIDMAIDPLRG